MLFAPGMSRFFATHPALIGRIKAIDPHFDASEFAEVRARLAASSVDTVAADGGTPTAPKVSTVERLDSLIGAGAVAPAAVAGLVGNPGTMHIQVAQDIRRSLPESLALAGRHPASARALLLTLALDSDPAARSRQQSFIEQQLGSEVTGLIAGLTGDVDNLEAQQRLPVLMQTFPALRQLTREERLQLMSCLNGMLQREGHMSLQSYVLRKLAQVHLRDDLDPRARVGALSISAASTDLQTLFSVLARHGHQSEEEARRAYEAGMYLLLPRERPAYAVPANWPQQLDVALSHLDRLAPVGKEQLVEALVRTVAHDQQLTIGEAELLRAVCAAVHCPLPPLVSRLD
jgi:hypothetical protein